MPRSCMTISSFQSSDDAGCEKSSTRFRRRREAMHELNNAVTGRSRSNRLFFAVNIALLGLSFAILHYSQWRLYHPRRAAGQDGRLLGMDVAYSKDNLSLLVGDSSVRNFKLFDTDQSMLMSSSDATGNDEEGSRVALVSLGSDFEIAVAFSHHDSQAIIHKITATISDAVYTDLNADGVYDLRSLPPGEGSAARHSVTQVRIKDKWLDVRRDARSTLDRELTNGSKVSFDSESGIWLLP